MRSLTITFLFLGCATTLVHPTTASIPRLRATTPEATQDKNVVISVEAVTGFNWKKYPEIVGKLAVEVKDETQVRSSGQGAPPQQMTLRYDDVALVSLPAFRVHISNHSGHAIKLDATKITLDDDHQQITALSVEEARAWIDGELRARENMGGRKLNQEQLQLVRGAISDLPLFKKDKVIADGEEWQGFVTFKIETERPIEHVTLRLDNLKLDEESQSFKFAYTVERRHGTRACKDGSAATPLGVCPGDEQETDPADEGPCIQKTRIEQNSTRQQWWIGATPVADSDLNRTLLLQPTSQGIIRRSLLYRGVGYGLVAAGIALSALAAVAIGREVGADKGPAGLAFLGISIAGAGVAYQGMNRTEKAVKAYNEQADAGGVCSTVW
jgi:hypothetical protein